MWAVVIFRSEGGGKYRSEANIRGEYMSCVLQFAGRYRLMRNLLAIRRDIMHR